MSNRATNARVWLNRVDLKFTTLQAHRPMLGGGSDPLSPIANHAIALLQLAPAEDIIDFIRAVQEIQEIDRQQGFDLWTGKRSI